MKAAVALLALAGAAPFAAQAADAATLRRGQDVYGRCIACHAIEQHRTGPAHCGLFGRRAGSAPGFAAYSGALRGSGIVWTEAALDRFLADPMRAVPGTSMTYLGVEDPKDRQALIAWLKQAGDPARGCRQP